MSRKYSREEIGQLVAAHSSFTTRLNGEGNGPLSTYRREAIRRFEEIGIPTTRHEEWKYTNVVPMTKIPFRSAEEVDDVNPDPAAVMAAGFAGEAIRLVFINGQLQGDLSSYADLQDGVTVMPLAQAIRERTELVSENIASYPDDFESPFVMLNTAHIRDGLFVHIGRNVQVDRPIHLLHYSAAGSGPVVSYPRSLVIVEQSASVELIEEFAGREGDVVWTNGVTEFQIGDNATVTHLKLQHESLEGYHFYASEARLGRDSQYLNNSISFGGKIARNEPVARLNGDGGHASLDGMYVVGKDQLVDSHTVIDHRSPNCTSHELYKGVLRDNGHGVFNGKIFVRKDAQKTDSKQSNMNLLLSDAAEIDTKPQLEIFADDVKCTHGATIGRLDPRGIFYLQARGIAKERATQMLTYAFAAEVVEHIADDTLRAYATELLDERLEK